MGTGCPGCPGQSFGITSNLLTPLHVQPGQIIQFIYAAPPSSPPASTPFQALNLCGISSCWRSTLMGDTRILKVLECSMDTRSPMAAPPTSASQSQQSGAPSPRSCSNGSNHSRLRPASDITHITSSGQAATATTAVVAGGTAAVAAAGVTAVQGGVRRTKGRHFIVHMDGDADGYGLVAGVDFPSECELGMGCGFVSMLGLV